MIEEYLLAVIQGERRSFLDLGVLGLLSLLEWVYRGLVVIRSVLYRSGIISQITLDLPVISLGNLAAGGTGKTPLTIFLARRLAELGHQPAVVIRGYRGEGAGARVVSDGESLYLSAEDTGDEAQLLARCLPGVPIIAGKDRAAGGRLAKSIGADIILLDDGMQYLKLRRDLDIVLLDAENPWENGHMIPRGLLREGPKGLKRAGMVVLSGSEIMDESFYRLRLSEIRQWNERVSVVRTGVQPKFVQRLADWWNNVSEAMEPGTFLRSRPIGMLTAIGRPAKFRRSLSALGAQIAFEIIRPDHHSWNIEDFVVLKDQGRFENDISILTTEKDAVKMGFLLSNPLAEQVFVLGIRTMIPPEDQPLLESVLKELNL